MRNLFQELVDTLDLLGGKIPEEHYGPIQKDGLRLVFPPEIDTPEKKIIASIYNQGQQGICNLSLLTNCSIVELKPALERLVTANRIIRHETHTGTALDELPMYDLLTPAA